MTKYQYLKRCVECGAEVLTKDKNRNCYKCESEMKVIKNYER